jgi:predicted transcriptional regulator of viral defense system
VLCLKADILSYRQRMPTARFRELTEIAVDRQGLIRTADAAEIGYAAGTLDTMARRGQLERVAQGVYRVPFLGTGPLSTYMAAALWPRGVQGVLTHETALDLWDVCDINPGKIHITVPRRHRPQRTIPGGYVIHREDLDPKDITAIEALCLGSCPSPQSSANAQIGNRSMTASYSRWASVIASRE